MSNDTFEGRVVGVKLMRDGPRSVTSDLWGYATPPCRVNVRFAPKTTTCIVMHIGHAICHGGIDEVQQQMGIVWPIAWQLKSCRCCKMDLFMLVIITSLFFLQLLL